MVYPDNDNGDVLRRLEAGGDDLSKARDVDFTIVFPSRDVAESFREHFHNAGYRVSVEEAKVVPGLPWDVQVVKHMAPSYEAISEFEAILDEVAAPLGGRNDGWGCIAQNEFA